jgi:predicted nicotinamide N-methyase
MLAHRMVRARAVLKLATGCGLLAVSSALVTTDVTARYTIPKLGLRPAEPAAQSLHLHSAGTAQDLAPARELQRYTCRSLGGCIVVICRACQSIWV